MDSVLLLQFQRVEAALSTLIESIASYNPSPQAALDLVAADDELSHGLDQLARHQANHSRILALRAQDQALESQLKSGIATLAQLRHELYDTPATTFSQNSRPVPFDELLQFAKNISKFTVPPTYRERIPKGESETVKDSEKANENAGSGPVSSNGLGTPANTIAPPAIDAPTTEEGKETAAQADEAAPKDASQKDQEWLEQLRANKLVWYPWPDDHKIRGGNLMAIQHLLDQGKRPEDINIFDEAEEEKKRADEEEKRKEDALTALEPRMPTENAVPTSAGPRPPQQPREAFNAFDDFDD
ncbi:hypothetical protein K504DRAFT_351938, partial [Pleomassaria siparia CBS 279.74]